MRKIAFLFVVVSCAVFLLAGCQNGADRSSADSSSTQSDASVSQQRQKTVLDIKTLTNSATGKAANLVIIRPGEDWTQADLDALETLSEKNNVKIYGIWVTETLKGGTDQTVKVSQADVKTDAEQWNAAREFLKSEEHSGARLIKISLYASDVACANIQKLFED